MHAWHPVNSMPLLTSSINVLSVPLSSPCCLPQVGDSPAVHIALRCSWHAGLAPRQQHEPAGDILDNNICASVFFRCRRSAIHPLYTLPCAAPGMLAWHPVNSMSLLATSPTGLFMLADPSNPAAAETYQVSSFIFLQ